MLKNKLAPLAVLLTGLALPHVQANDIEPTKEKYTAPFTLTPITLDGKLSEWGGVGQIVDPKFAVPKGSGGGANPKYVLFEEYAGGTWTGPDDQTSAVQVAYDNDNVYFGFVVTDDYHENAAHSAWNGDSVQLMIANGTRNAQVALYNYALGGVEGAIDDTIIMHEAGPGGTEAVVTRDAATKKTYYEIKLPATALGLTAPLKAGTKFGLGMAINDGDELTPGQRGWGGLGAHSIVFGKTPGETALVTLGPSEPTIEILGVGAESLLGGDLTDPENDGNEDAGPNDASWNWAGITSNIEPGFGGGEYSFNIFDNKVGGGSDKWCCDDPTPDKPYWVAVQFSNPVSLTHFTVTSGNDTPGRDPVNWQIQGSQDGVNYSPIFVYKADTAPWTDRNQVIKFTLPIPSVPFRYVRYIVFDTPANLHQINEIEYFGTYGGTALAYYSAINPQITKFSYRLTDAGTSVIDVNSVKLKIDGQLVAIPTPVKTAAGVIDVSYTPATQFLPGSKHTYALIAKDGVGNNINSEGTWTTAQYALLTAADKVTPVTSKPGFIWNVHQNNAFGANDNTRPALQLAGALGKNFADPSASGAAIGAGTPGANENLPIRFELDSVLNLSQAGGENNGNFGEDGQMPGIPGLGESGQTDGIAAEVLTYVELPAGLTTMIVNSDDGFRTTGGNVGDVFKSQFAGEFVGGRGASDTSFTVFAETAGVYPFRTVWYEGGGGANIEWLTVKADGTKVLLNDTANGGLKAYRAISGAGPTVISSVNPLPGATGVAFDTSLSAKITDGSDAVDAASVKLTLDGEALAVSATKAGGVSSISFTPASFLASGSQHTATLTYKAGANTRTETWSFTVVSYATLTKSQQATGVNTSKPGFIWNVFQNGSYTHTSLAQTEDALAGKLKNGATPITDNLADPSATGVAIGAGVKVGPLYKFEIDTVINMSQSGGESNGNFPDDGQMPGIPGTGESGQTDGIDGEVLTFIDLPKGVITMGVNSDDGFRTTAGYLGNAADASFLGQFDGGRGASDSLFKFVVSDAGIYPFRTIWNEGGGGANIEIFTVKADGTKVLVNDVANGGFKAYRVGTVPVKPTLPPALGIVRNANGSLTITFEGTLEVSDTVNGTYTPVAGATSPLTVPADQVARFARARR